MKKIFIITAVFCLLLSSCEKFLDAFPESSISAESFWRTESDFEKFLTNIYGNSFSHNGLWCQFHDEALSDNAYCRWSWYSGANVMAVANGTADVYGNVVSGTWTKAYANIRSCYYVLENIEEAAISQAKKEEYTGETKFLLAYNYYMLVNYFGRVPLVQKVLSTQESKEVVQA
ncbi:MAG: RagB/SusD family nutrient uptake outer membrane protein, partial [Tannerellaceae bacterium]|nr:RagB/SusD family nutrient uptake outer membrane protein [Tannerellaceae bacterium]